MVGVDALDKHCVGGQGSGVDGDGVALDDQRRGAAAGVDQSESTSVSMVVQRICRLFTA